MTAAVGSLFRQVLEEVGSTNNQSSVGTTAMSGRRQPWELRSVIHDKFKSLAEGCGRIASQGEEHQNPGWSLSRLREDGIRDSMDGAIELR